MPHFLHQIAYSREGWQAIVNNPEDRIQAVRPAVEHGSRVTYSVARAGTSAPKSRRHSISA